MLGSVIGKSTQVKTGIHFKHGKNSQRTLENLKAWMHKIQSANTGITSRNEP